MEQTTESQLSAILAKEPSGLTEADAAFLRARRDYLTEDQQITYASVLDVPTEAPPSADPHTDEAPEPTEPKKKAK